MLHYKRASLLIAAALLTLRAAAALYEDQVGTFDWYQQHVGAISTAQFHPTKPRVCVVTAQNVLGCLNLRDGSIGWRKLLSTGLAISSSSVVLESQGIAAAVDGVLQFFDLEGNLKWHRKLQGSSLPPQLLHVPGELAGFSGDAVLALRGTGLQIFSSADGKEVLSTRVSSNMEKQNAVVHATGEKAYVIAYDTGSYEATVIDIQGSGQRLQERTYRSTLALSQQVAATADSVAVLSADSTALCVANLSSTAPSFTCHTLSAVCPALGALKSANVLGLSAGYAIVSRDAGNPGVAIFRLREDGQLALLVHYASAIGLSEEIAVDGGKAVGLVEIGSKEGLKLVVVSAGSGDIMHEEVFPDIPNLARTVEDVQRAQPTNVAIGAFRKKDKALGFRAIVSFDNGVTAMLQQGVVVWSRDESLAAIKETVFVDLPARKANGTALGGLEIGLGTRLRYQILGAKVQLKLNSPEEAAAYLQMRSALSDKSSPFRDVNGFRKILVALTTAGKVAALHSGNGRVLWSRAFPTDSAPTRLLPWREYHDIQHAPEVLLLREQQPGPYAMVINAHTGEIIWSTQLAYSVDHVMHWHEPLHEGSAYQSLYLLKEERNASLGALVHLIPDTAASRAHVATQQAAYMFTREQRSNSLHGFKLEPNQGSPEGLSAIDAWRLEFPGSILASVARDATEPIQSSVKVMSDRSIKYKYLNPNLIFVAAGSETAGSDGDGVSAEVTVYLVDTVAGRILHQQAHAGARGPVTAVLTENMVLYFFRDIESGRHMACSMELYDATAGRDFSVLDYLFNPNSTQPVSSFDPTPVEVVSQCFFSRVAPTAAAVTRTEQGITSKQLLLATNTDQVYAMDRRWVDPRRPKKQKLSQEEMEEGLVPYQDTLPLSPLSFATLDKQVLGIRSVAVQATRLESTCLLFVHGVDLFFTRLAPAKGFDSLEDDFNYALLLAALVGLAGGSVVLSYMAKQTALGQKWK